MSNLPEEIIEDNILTRLPVKSISRFRCVSKKWHLLFQNPKFIKTHLNHANQINNFNILIVTNYAEIDSDDEADLDPYLYSMYNTVLTSTSSPFSGHAHKIDYPFMTPRSLPKFLGSCNGLVCTEAFYGNICIWNPATREYTSLPDAPFPSKDFHQGSSFSVAYGFGFDCRNDDYKLVRIVGSPGVEFSEATVYSLASNSWKELGFISYRLDFSVDEGIHLDGVHHWVATVCRNGIKSSVTVCYDISDEIFRDVPLLNYNPYEDGNYGIWEGKLCKLRRNHMEEDPDNDHIDVWTMMDNKWSKHLKITAQLTDMRYRRPIQTLQNGEILLEGELRGKVGIGLMSYDPNLERPTPLEIHGFPDEAHFLVIQTYVETLVALNSGTYVAE